MGSSRIPELDGLRALAMTAVVAQHCGLAPFGWTGVWLFFVISGYVISRNFVQRRYQAGGWADQYRAFMLRRFFRIVPAYVLYIAVAALAVAAVGNRAPLGDVPFLLTFSYNWHMIFDFWSLHAGWAGFGHLWTLSIEEQFYLVYPLLFLLLSGNAHLATLCALVALGPIVRLVYATGLASASIDGAWVGFAVYASSFAQFDAFLLGALIAHCEDALRKRAWVAHCLAGAALLAAAAYVAWCVHLNRSGGATGLDLVRNIFSGVLYSGGREVFVYSAIDLLAAAAVVYAILQKPIFRPLTHPAIVLVGRVSYGGYLYHALVLWTVAGLVGPLSAAPVLLRLILFALVWAITVGLAYASFRWYETPIIRWSRTPRGEGADAVAFPRPQAAAGLARMAADARASSHPRRLPPFEAPGQGVDCIRVPKPRTGASDDRDWDAHQACATDTAGECQTGVSWASFTHLDPHRRGHAGLRGPRPGADAAGDGHT